MKAPVNSDAWPILFREAPRANQERFVALYAYELTVLARGYFDDKEYGRALKCNETIHRLMGFLMTLLDESKHPESESFLEMVRAGANANRWGQVLLLALRRAAILDDT